MNRRLTSLFAALEALLVAGVGVGIPLVPLTLMWAFQYGLTLDWLVFWRAAVDTWLLGHGVDIRFTLDPAIAASSGFAGAAAPFVITIAPLAFALVTALLGVRAGRRIGETPHRLIGTVVGLGVFAVLSLGVAFTALAADARPSLVQSALLPTLVFGLGVLIGSWSLLADADAGSTASAGGGGAAGSSDPSSGEPRVQAHASSGTAARGVRFERMRTAAAGALSRASASVSDVDRRLRSAMSELADGRAVFALRVAATGGAGAVAIMLVISAITVAIMIGVSYARVISLFEAVQSGILGGVALTIAQLAFIPNLVIWATSWFVGPGFALGTGSAVSPLGTDLGPLPAIPLLGALPTSPLAFGYVGLLVPVLAGFLAAIMLRPRLAREGVEGPLMSAAAGMGMGLVGGIMLGALAWISSGSAGPGRLSDVGSSWLLVGCWGALEIGLAAAVALLVGGIRRAQPEAAALE